MILCSIWGQHNKQLWDGQSLPPRQTAQFELHYCEEWWAAKIGGLDVSISARRDDDREVWCTTAA